MTPRLTQVGTHIILLLPDAAWTQAWMQTECLEPAGDVAYVTHYDRAEPRGFGDGADWCAVHATGEDLSWTRVGDGPATVWWADSPYLFPINRLEWAGRGDWNLDGQVDVFDLLAYLDWWFIESVDVGELAWFVDGWLRG